MQSRADNPSEMLKSQLQAWQGSVLSSATLFHESIISADQVSAWVELLKAHDDESKIHDVFGSMLEKIKASNISIRDGIHRVLHRFIYQARILQLENYHLAQLNERLLDYFSPEHQENKPFVLSKMERIFSLLPALSEQMIFDQHVKPLLDLQSHNWNDIKKGITYATLIYKNLMNARRREMILLINHYLDSHSHDQRELICFLLNADINLLSVDEKRAIFLILDKYWNENHGFKSVEQIIYLNAIWQDISLRERKRLSTLIFNQIKRDILSGGRVTVGSMLPVPLIWNTLQAEQRSHILRHLAVQSRLDGDELLQYQQFAPLILRKIDVHGLSDSEKRLVKLLFQTASIHFSFNSHWYRAFLNCASLFSESEVLEQLNKLCDYIKSGEMSSVEYGDARNLLSAMCLQLSYAQRAKFVDQWIDSFNSGPLSAVNVVVEILVALLVSELEEDLQQSILTALLKKPENSLVSLCYRVCRSEKFELNQEQWCQLIAAFVFSFFQPHQSKMLVIESIVRAFNQLTYRQDKEGVLKVLLDETHDWQRERTLPCLLLRLHDAIPHAERDRAIELVVAKFIEYADWIYESVASHALMAVIPYMTTQQLMLILLKQFKTAEPVTVHHYAYELYLRVFREYEARLLVKTHEQTSYLGQLHVELQDKIRDQLNLPTARPPALSGLNP